MSELTGLPSDWLKSTFTFDGWHWRRGLDAWTTYFKSEEWLRSNSLSPTSKLLEDLFHDLQVACVLMRVNPEQHLLEALRKELDSTRARLARALVEKECMEDTLSLRGTKMEIIVRHEESAFRSAVDLFLASHDVRCVKFQRNLYYQNARSGSASTPVESQTKLLEPSDLHEDFIAFVLYVPG